MLIFRQPLLDFMLKRSRNNLSYSVAHHEQNFWKTAAALCAWLRRLEWSGTCYVGFSNWSSTFYLITKSTPPALDVTNSVMCQKRNHYIHCYKLFIYLLNNFLLFIYSKFKSICMIGKCYSWFHKSWSLKEEEEIKRKRFIALSLFMR